jgi:hypothetical protein
MDFRSQINGHWLKKLAICLVFAIFFMAKANAGVIVPTITGQPSDTSVQKGDTASFTVSAECLLNAIGSVTWYCTSNNVTRPVATNTFLVTLLTINNTLTINNVSSNNVGNYYAVVANLLANTIKSSSASLGIAPPVIAQTTNSVMMAKGFKLQFSGPVGSNLVIQATSDMVHWSPILTNVIPSSGSVTYTDAVAKTLPGRFYRAMLK